MSGPDRAFMSPRDTYWFLAGAASGLMIGALGVYFLTSAPGTPKATASPTAASAGPTASAGASAPDLLMPGDRWPTLADADSAGVAAAGTADSAGNRAGGASAGSLEEVTRNLAQRLATKGGTDDEWRLLAQSYEYMGRTNDARAARMHVKAGDAKATPAAGHPSRITGTIQIAPDLAAAALPGATLFVYATEPGTPGPPLAVRKLKVDRWPMSFALEDADAMVPGRSLSGASRVQLEARISPSGEALPRAGDLAGKLDNVDPHATEPVKISIDHKIG